ncbi:MAG: glycosyltransferase [Planctomycetes bacterium]|nr:glycosyltransferase [Planctomycetota bacterium]
MTRHVMFVMYGWANSGGGTMLPRAAARELAATGVRVSVVYAAARRDPSLPEYALRRHEESGVALYGLVNRPSEFMDLRAPRREIDDPRLRGQFAALLDELRPDVVHFWNLHSLGMSVPAECRRRAIPTVLSSNNYWAICPRLYLVSERLQRCDGPTADGARCRRCLGGPAEAADYGARRAAGVQLLRSGVDLHLAVSERVRELYVANGDDPGHVRVLRQEPPGVTAIWQRVGERRPIVERLERPLRIGYVGSVMAHKGVHVLAQALQRLVPSTFEAVALGDIAPDYADVLQRFDPHGRLHLTGRYDQERLPELLAKLDVVVVPSIWDDCAPFVVAEALAARCPVVGSSIGGIPDFVIDGGNGLLFEAGNSAQLAARLATFTRDPAQLGRMQRAIAPPRGLNAFVGDLLVAYSEVGAVSSVS